jgi:hypothetical protein
MKELRKQLLWFSREKYGNNPKMYKAGIPGLVGNADCNAACDHLEVFIPMKAGDLKDKELPCPQS